MTSPAPRKLVVFDWDGTLMDTTAIIASGMRHAARELGCQVPERSAALRVIGLGWQRALTEAIPDLKPEDYPRFAAVFRDWYLPNEKRVVLFPGVKLLLSRLREKGVRLAVATGKSRPGLDRVLAQTGLGPLFETTVTADEYRPKPDPEMLEAVLLETGVAAQDAVMVGDTTHDLFMARAAKVAAIGVTTGGQRPEELLTASPETLCANTVELAAALGFPGLVTIEEYEAETHAEEAEEKCLE